MTASAGSSISKRARTKAASSKRSSTRRSSDTGRSSSAMRPRCAESIRGRSGWGFTSLYSARSARGARPDRESARRKHERRGASKRAAQLERPFAVGPRLPAHQLERLHELLRGARAGRGSGIQQILASGIDGQRAVDGDWTARVVEAGEEALVVRVLERQRIVAERERGAAAAGDESR